MEMLQQIFGILGAIFVIGFIIVAIVVAFLIFRLKKLLSGQDPSPARIHLLDCQISELVWSRKDELKQAQTDLLAAGFSEIGEFRVTEMPSLNLQSFANEKSNSMAVIYEMEPVGLWIDLLKYYLDETSLTATSATMGQDLKQRPGHDKTRMAGASVTQLIGLLSENDKGKEARPVETSPEKFKQIFEKAYADEMDWRHSLGGPSEAEIRAVAKSSGINADDEAIAKALLLEQRKACNGLEIAFGEVYRSKHNITETQYLEIQPSLIFIHDKVPSPILGEIIAKAGLVVPQDLCQAAEAIGARNTFRKNLENAGPIEKIDELDYPLPVDVYRLLDDLNRPVYSSAKT